MSAEERRAAFARWDTEFLEGAARERVTRQANTWWDTMLAYFYETEPAVADAIRYGLAATQAVGRNYLDDAPLPVFLQVNYPDETKP